MKRKVLSLALVLTAVAFSASSAQAQEMQSVTGEVIDIVCYTNMGMTGEGHRECAQSCADVGLPLGLLGEDGNVYLATAPGMMAPLPKDMLRGHAAHQVTLEGMINERSGARAIVVSKVSM